LAILLCGLVAPYVLTCLLLWLAGVFPQFWFWTVSYARQYAAAIPLVNAPEFLRGGVRTVVGPNLVFWILPWIGAVMMWWDERLNVRARFLVVALVLCCFASMAIGLYFRGHYFITFLPALATLCGIAVSRSLHALKHERSLELFIAIPVAMLFAIGVGSAVVGNGAVWFASSPGSALREVYGSTLFADAREVSAVIKGNTAPQSRIAVLGSEPEIYFYTQRLSATGYIYTYPLMEAQPFARKMQEEMIKEIERFSPEYLIYIDDDFSWLRTGDSPENLDHWWKDYWSTQLNLVKTVAIREQKEKLEFYQKPDSSAQGPARPAKHIMVFQRRLRP